MIDGAAALWCSDVSTPGSRYYSRELRCAVLLSMSLVASRLTLPSTGSFRKRCHQSVAGRRAGQPDLTVRCAFDIDIARLPNGRRELTNLRNVDCASGLNRSGQDLCGAEYRPIREVTASPLDTTGLARGQGL